MTRIGESYLPEAPAKQHFQELFQFSTLIPAMHSCHSVRSDFDRQAESILAAAKASGKDLVAKPDFPATNRRLPIGIFSARQHDFAIALQPLPNDHSEAMDVHLKAGPLLRCTNPNVTFLENVFGKILDINQRNLLTCSTELRKRRIRLLVPATPPMMPAWLDG